MDAVAIDLASDEEIEVLGFTKGYIGPYGLQIKFHFDSGSYRLRSIEPYSRRKPKDSHYINANYGRDYTADMIKDIRLVKAGEDCPKSNGKLHSARGIECGHILSLETNILKLWEQATWMKRRVQNYADGLLWNRSRKNYGSCD